MGVNQLLFHDLDKKHSNQGTHHNLVHALSKPTRQGCPTQEITVASLVPKNRGLGFLLVSGIGGLRFLAFVVKSIRRPHSEYTMFDIGAQQCVEMGESFLFHIFAVLSSNEPLSKIGCTSQN